MEKLLLTIVHPSNTHSLLLKYMKILVTGAAGFIGYHVSNHLIEAGHSITGIDNLCDNKDAGIKDVRLSLLGIDAKTAGTGQPCSGNNGFTFIRMDVLNRAAICELCRNESFDIIIHLAALTGTTKARMNPAEFYETNVSGTINLLEAARQYGVQHFFFSSSSCVYSALATPPFTEEDHVDTPMNMYAASKRSAELLCYSYAKAYGIPVTIFRLFSVYGPWARPDSIPMQLAHRIMKGAEIRVLNNGHIVRDFTYIEDLLEGLNAALLNQPFSMSGVPYALYNVGRGKPVSFLSFIQSLEYSLSRNAEVVLDEASPLAVGERVEMYADTSKLERELAYSPVWDYEEAIPLFADWFLKHYGTTFNM